VLNIIGEKGAGHKRVMKEVNEETRHILGRLHRTTKLSTRQEMTKVHTRQVEHKTGIMTNIVKYYYNLK